MFVAEFLICMASSYCIVMQEKVPVLFKTEQVCLDHAEARLPEVSAGHKYQYAVVRCRKIKGKSV